MLLYVLIISNDKKLIEEARKMAEKANLELRTVKTEDELKKYLEEFRKESQNIKVLILVSNDEELDKAKELAQKMEIDVRTRKVTSPDEAKRWIKEFSEEGGSLEHHHHHH
uniref:rossmann 2x2 fold protein n=1 Tax=synthetic construct TaxID=32630 RepID=UPI0001BEF2D0|nr:Chain A, rossmann 2x2 fold protein [synthetic construct]2LV8_A Chain A, De novo designed rossmann 2x2 fold protein [synthetic construct]